MTSPALDIILRGTNYPARWGLVSYLKLDEASGVYADSYGTNNLTNVNSVVAAAGTKVGAGAAQFVAASSQQLNCADNASLSTGDVEFWIACWVWVDSLAADHALVAKGTGTSATTREFTLTAALSSARFIFQMGDVNNTGTAQVNAATNGATTGAWHFLLAGRDKAADTLFLRQNHGTIVTASAAGKIPPDTAGLFRLGVLNAATSYHDGRLDAVAFGKSPPVGMAAVADEISARLWNGGAGREYPWR